MKFTKEGFALITRFEGCELKAYPDPYSPLGKATIAQKLSLRDYHRLPEWKALDGAPWTIGFGSTHGVSEGMVITQLEANRRLLDDIAATESGIKRFIKTPLSDNQYSACVVLAFNIGVTAFKGSTLLSLINEGKLSEVPKEFPKWRLAGGKVSKGLINRRFAEQALFLKG